MTKFFSAVMLIGISGVTAALAVPACAVWSAPELDPASLMTGLTLLAGGLVMVRGRMKGAQKD